MRRRFVAAIAFSLAACGLEVVGIDPFPSDGSGEPDANRSETSMNDVVAADAVIDAPNEPADADPCHEADVCVPHRVFITSESMGPDLGGADGADATCQSFAEKASLGGTWRAWISTSKSSPSSRFAKSLGPYQLIDGTIVADSWADLVKRKDGGVFLHVGIHMNEKGEDIGNKEAWSATTTTGTAGSLGCADFTSADGGGTAGVGIGDRTGSDWTFAYTQNCFRTDPRLYCFEQ